LKIRHTKYGDKTIGVSNHSLVGELKEKYYQQVEQIAKDGFKLEHIKFYCLGKELKSDLFLYSYDIKDEMTVQAMIFKG